ncbi:DUF3305 domain-containing protein [Thioalkalivibrio sp. XN279]|uniref:DUF3305 domain-containing protein n=1 Tax=Thioalkalivibrio sp. XN279 TaxID=2714953 RepID=UPI00140AF9A6|nr:DUF3305 domain-containing protein [Thioalkalivibrio sp. XN279]NHA15952.1 DUF3305 domain-containing protein [Thioalkalivibrio sp. XN279]
MRPKPQLSIPVGAVLARKVIQRAGWSLANWEGVAVLAGERFAAGESRCVPLREIEGATQYLWDGLRLDLYRDAAETYWFNLTGTRPSLFIICSEEDGELQPVAVTADHDESTSAVEADYKVFAVPVPAEIIGQLEEFVMTHFKPKERKKRRREDWGGEERQ